MKGQITIEYVLVLVIVLTIVSLVSIPLINYAEDSIKDVGYGVLLANKISKILDAIHTVSVSGCGSRYTVNVSLSPLDTLGARITIDQENISGSYYLQNGTLVSVKTYSYPDYIKVTCNTFGNTAKVVIERDCSTKRPNNNCVIGEV